MIFRRTFAVGLSFLLPALPASAQVRSVPAEAGATPLAAPAGRGPAASFSSALTLSLSAPSLGPSLTAPVPATERYGEEAPLPLAIAKRPAALAVAPSPAAAIAPRRAAPAASAAARAGMAANGIAVEITAGYGRGERIGADAGLDALFDGRRNGAGVATASAPDQRPGAPRTALKPKAPGRNWRIAAVALPSVAAAAVFGALAPNLAQHALHWLGQGAYWLANPFAFAFTIPQIHRMLTRHSADVSTAMVTVGLLSTLLMTLNFAFDGKDLMMARNLAQAAGFAVMLVLKSRFTRAPAGVLPSRRRAALETGAVALGIGGLLLAAGPLLAAAMPAVSAMHSLLVPFQVLSGFGFTYLMYAQLAKMRRDHSVGDSSPMMMWAYLGTKTIWVWSLATMLTLSTAPAWLTLSSGALFTGVAWFAGKAALSRLLKAPWRFLPESLSLSDFTLSHDAMSEIASFLLLSVLILALSGAGYLAFTAALAVPAAAAPRFAMYLLYTVQSLVACLATLKTLRMRARFDKKS